MCRAMKRPVGILHVKILRATQLRKKDLLGASDPYVKIKLTESKLPSKKTSVKHKNLNPEWNEEFSMVVKDPESQVLEIYVYDWEQVILTLIGYGFHYSFHVSQYVYSCCQVGKHEKMGMNVIPLKDLAPDDPKTMTLDLLKNMDPNDIQNNKSRGQVMMELTYKPFKEEDKPNDAESGTVEKAPEGTPPGGGVLVVLIHEAEDVEGKHHTNPYVRIILKGEEKKTKVHACLPPIFVLFSPLLLFYVLQNSFLWLLFWKIVSWCSNNIQVNTLLYSMKLNINAFLILYNIFMYVYFETKMACLPSVTSYWGTIVVNYA